MPGSAGHPVVVRPARSDEGEAVLAVIGADPVTRSRVDGPWPTERQRSAFRRIVEHPDHDVLVAERDGRIVGTVHLAVLPELARGGADRAQLEAVHVLDEVRGEGVGRRLIEAAVDEARARGCGLVQLTTAKSRGDAHAFYARLGFEATHEGLKRAL